MLFKREKSSDAIGKRIKYAVLFVAIITLEILGIKQLFYTRISISIECNIESYIALWWDNMSQDYPFDEEHLDVYPIKSGMKNNIFICIPNNSASQIRIDFGEEISEWKLYTFEVIQGIRKWDFSSDELLNHIQYANLLEISKSDNGTLCFITTGTDGFFTTNDLLIEGNHKVSGERIFYIVVLFLIPLICWLMLKLLCLVIKYLVHPLIKQIIRVKNFFQELRNKGKNVISRKAKYIILIITVVAVEILGIKQLFYTRIVLYLESDTDSYVTVRWDNLSSQYPFDDEHKSSWEVNADQKCKLIFHVPSKSVSQMRMDFGEEKSEWRLYSFKSAQGVKKWDIENDRLMYCMGYASSLEFMESSDDILHFKATGTDGFFTINGLLSENPYAISKAGIAYIIGLFVLPLICYIVLETICLLINFAICPLMKWILQANKLEGASQSEEMALISTDQKEKRKGLIAYICITVFLGLIYFRLPLIQDAWASNGDYYKAGGFDGWLRTCFALYHSLNGRTLATILIGFFERNEFILDIACILSLLTTVFLYQRCLQYQKPSGIFYILFAIFAVPVGIRTEVYFYATLIYTLPVLFIGLFIICLNKYIALNKFESTSQYILFLVVGYLNAAWIEHTSCAFVVFFAIFIIYDAIRTKHFNVKLCIAEVIFCVAFFVMMLSPGLKLHRDFAVEHQSIFATIGTNLNTLSRFIFTEHSNMLVLAIIACLLFTFLNKERFRVSSFKKIYIGTMMFWLVFVINGFGLQSCPWITPEITTLLQILLLGEFLIPIIKSKNKTTLLIFYFTGLMSLAPVIITPNLSYRVCHYFFVMFNFITVAFWIENLAKLQRLKNVLAFFLLAQALMVMDVYCAATYNICKTQNNRETLINEVVNLQCRGKWDYDDVLVLPRFSPGLLYADASPENYYDRIHYQSFLNYYHLNPATLVYFGDSYDKLRAIRHTNRSVALYAEPMLNNISYTYQFQMMRNNIVVAESSAICKSNYNFTIPNIAGSYYFRCILTDSSENEIIVYSPIVIDIE